MPIPKVDGEEVQFAWGVPTVADRVAQMVVKRQLEPELDCLFHDDSYAYRRFKAAHDAVGKARQRGWRYDWVLDLDIKGFFDSIDFNLRPKPFSPSRKSVALSVSDLMM